LKFEIIQEIHLDQVEHDDRIRGSIRKGGYVGYAHCYLKQCCNESEFENNADVEIYKKLLDIDSKFETTESEQLFECVFHSFQMNLIEV